MSLAVGAYKVGGAGQCLAWEGGIHGNPASGCHQAPSHWTIQWNTYLALTSRRGRDWKKQSTKWHANSKLLQQHFAKNCKQATVYTNHKVPLLEALGHPQYSWKNCLPSLLQGWLLPNYIYPHLNSSPIGELGNWCLQSWWNWAMP